MNSETRNKISEEDVEIDMNELYTKLERYKITDRQMFLEELPTTGAFDLYATLTDNVAEFGLAKDFTKTGWAVRYTGNAKIKIKNGSTINMFGQLGYIAGESNGRIILQTDHGYFGWLNPEDYEIINLVDNFSTLAN